MLLAHANSGKRRRLYYEIFSWSDLWIDGLDRYSGGGARYQDGRSFRRFAPFEGDTISPVRWIGLCLNSIIEHFL